MIRRVLAAALRTRAFGVLGLGLLLAGQAQYRSYAGQAVLGRWSHFYFVFLLVWLGVLAASLAWAFRASRRYGQLGRIARARMGLLDLGLLGWGGAFLLSALDNPDTAGRLTDLNLFGSTYPPSVLIEWIAAGLFVAALIVLAFQKLPTALRGPLAAAAAILLLLTAGEGAFRIRSIVAPSTQGIPTYCGALWERYHVTLNHLGYRDAEHAKEKPPGVRRLLVVGDSFAFGWGIDRPDDRFGERLAGELTRANGEHWEPLNASRPDTHTLDHIGFLESLAPYDPDAVILLYVFNDIDYIVPVTPRLMPGKYSLRSLAYLNSHLFQEVFARFRQVRYRLSSAPATDPYSNADAVSRHLGDLGRFVEQARAGQARTWIVPFVIGVAPGDAALERCQRLVAAADAAGLPMLPVCELFLGRPLPELAVNRLDAHPNAEANALLATHVAEAIAPQLAGAR